jgi:ABC-type glycerol-3-phosphate transport system substrate-binding protein
MPLDGPLDPGFFEGLHPAGVSIYQYPEVSTRGSGRKRQYGVPLDLDIPLIYYRNDLVKPVMEELGMTEFPQTWEDFLRLGRAFAGRRNASGQTLHFTALDPEDPVPFQMAVLPASGGRLLSDRLDKAVFNDVAGVEAFGLYRQLLRDGSALRWNRSTEGDPMLAYKTDRAAVTVNGPWLAKYLQSRAPEQSGRWRVALFPRRQRQFPVAGLGGACVAVPYNAPNREAALKLIRFMTTEQFGLAYFRRVGSIPPLKSAWKSPEFHAAEPYFGGQRVQAIVRDAINQSVALQLLPNSEILRGPVRRALSQACDTDRPLTDIAETAVMEINRLLEIP